jgi:hypothetical protein
MAHLSGDAHDTFAAERSSLLKKFLRQIGRIENGLGATFAVANIDKNQSAEVAAGMDPARQRHGLFDMRWAQFVAMMCAFHSNADCGIRIAEFSIQSKYAWWLEIQWFSKRFLI